MHNFYLKKMITLSYFSMAQLLITLLNNNNDDDDDNYMPRLLPSKKEWSDHWRTVTFTYYFGTQNSHGKSDHWRTVTFTYYLGTQNSHGKSDHWRTVTFTYYFGTQNSGAFFAVSALQIIQ